MGCPTAESFERYRLDDDAQSKLREIIEKRAEDKDRILVSIKTPGGVVLLCGLLPFSVFNLANSCRFDN